MHRVILAAAASLCWTAYAIWSVADHSAAWKVVIGGLASVAFAVQTLRLWRQVRSVAQPRLGPMR